MTERASPIAAVQGAPSAVIQELLWDFVASLRPRVPVAGVLEKRRNDRDRSTAWLYSLADERRYAIFQNLGANSRACALDGASVVAACEAVRRDIGAGCDLVVLSKFGRLEAQRTGLSAAFAAALEAQAPILTSVTSKFEAEWSAFAAPLFVMLPPEESAIRRWWDSVRLSAVGVPGAELQTVARGPLADYPNQRPD